MGNFLPRWERYMLFNMSAYARQRDRTDGASSGDGVSASIQAAQAHFSLSAALYTSALPPDGSRNRILWFMNQLRRRFCFWYLREPVVIVCLTWLPGPHRKQTARTVLEQYWKLLQKGKVSVIDAWLAARGLSSRGLEVISDSWESIPSQNGLTGQVRVTRTQPKTDWTENHSFLNWNRLFQFHMTVRCWKFSRIYISFSEN